MPLHYQESPSIWWRIIIQGCSGQIHQFLNLCNEKVKSTEKRASEPPKKKAKYNKIIYCKIYFWNVGNVFFCLFGGCYLAGVQNHPSLEMKWDRIGYNGRYIGGRRWEHILMLISFQIQPQFTDRGVQGQKGCITVSHGITIL